MLRIDAARAQLRRPRPWSWCGARPKTGPDDTFEARTAARSARVPVGEVARAARLSLWVSRGPTDHFKYATSPFMTPEPVSAAVSGAALRRPARGACELCLRLGSIWRPNMSTKRRGTTPRGRGRPATLGGLERRARRKLAQPLGDGYAAPMGAAVRSYGLRAHPIDGRGPWSTH